MDGHGMKRAALIFLLVTVLLTFRSIGGPAVCLAAEKAGFDPLVTSFAALKEKQTETLASKLGVEVDPRARKFFQIARLGDSVALSNYFESALASKWRPALTNALWVPVHEAYGFFELFENCDGGLLHRFGDAVLQSIPPNSIYFGGTDVGRFMITALNDLTKGGGIYVITQNQIADMRYVAYVRAVYGDRLWIPPEDEIRAAFQRSAAEIQARGGSVHTNADGRISIWGAADVMVVSGEIVKLVFEHNKNRHSFYVEESYALPWMYPHLEPFGMIMRLNTEPSSSLDVQSVRRDRQYWDALTRELIGDPRFTKDKNSQKMFSKLRAAIAGVYAYRKMAEEAEYAYKQAVTLCETGPEANAGLATLYADSGRFDEALSLLRRLQTAHAQDAWVAGAIRRIEQKLQQSKPAPESRR